jgi:hypothetical protein
VVRKGRKDVCRWGLVSAAHDELSRGRQRAAVDAEPCTNCVLTHVGDVDALLAEREVVVAATGRNDDSRAGAVRDEERCEGWLADVVDMIARLVPAAAAARAVVGCAGLWRGLGDVGLVGRDARPQRDAPGRRRARRQPRVSATAAAAEAVGGGSRWRSQRDESVARLGCLTVSPEASRSGSAPVSPEACHRVLRPSKRAPARAWRSPLRDQRQPSFSGSLRWPPGSEIDDRNLTDSLILGSMDSSS